MSPFGIMCVLFVVWQYATSSPVTVTEYEFVREADAWLRLHIVPATWSDAAVRCQLEGGVLATPSIHAMTQAMLIAMDKHQLASNSVFIGASGLFSKGDFKSLDGAGIAGSLEWALGQPDNADNAEDCLALTNAGKLDDVSCARVLPYFCRKTAHNCTSDSTDSKTEVLSCGSNGYEWEPRTGSCYKFHGDSKNWRSALATCHAEGGHLAIINSAAESTALKNLYKEKAHTITGAEEARQVFVGFRKYDDGEWATVYGETLAEAGFEGWDHDEPSNGGGKIEESCGSIHRNGLINDASCVWNTPFICEINL